MIILRAFLTGLAAGSSLGPVALWGGRLRGRGYRSVTSIILGAALADITYGAVLIMLAKRFDIPLVGVKEYFDWAAIPGLLSIAFALTFMSMRPVSKKRWPQTLRFVAAFGATAVLPGTPLFVAGCLIEGWRLEDDLRIFFPVFAAGVIGMWMINLECFYRLEDRAALLTRAISVGCVLVVFARAVAWLV